MNKNYISHIAESKIRYHKQSAKMSYEEKFKIILELQKIDCDMRNNKLKNSKNIIKKVWTL